MNHLNAFLEMLDSQRIVYKRYNYGNTIEIAMPAFEHWICYDFDLEGNFESVWDRNYEYPDDLED